MGTKLQSRLHLSLTPCPEPYCEGGIIPQENGSSLTCRTCQGRGEVEREIDPEEGEWRFSVAEDVTLRPVTRSYWEPSASQIPGHPTIRDLERQEVSIRKGERA